MTTIRLADPYRDGRRFSCSYTENGEFCCRRLADAAVETWEGDKRLGVAGTCEKHAKAVAERELAADHRPLTTGYYQVLDDATVVVQDPSPQYDAALIESTVAAVGSLARTMLDKPTRLEREAARIAKLAASPLGPPPTDTTSRAWVEHYAAAWLQSLAALPEEE